MENSDELIEKMKSLNLKRKPGWHFTLKTAFYWFLFLGFCSIRVPSLFRLFFLQFNRLISILFHTCHIHLLNS